MKPCYVKGPKVVELVRPDPVVEARAALQRPWLPHLLALVTMGLTFWILRPDPWLGLQGDGAFYQSLSENGRWPLDAEQDLSYFPQRLSLLVPERLVNLLVGDTSGYLLFRLLLAGALTCVALASLPAALRLRAAGLVGAATATTPPAIGWLSQNYPTVATGLAIAAGAVATARLASVKNRRDVIGCAVVVGVAGAMLVHGHWGSAYLGWPVFLVFVVMLLRRPARAFWKAATCAAVAAGVAAATVLSALGIWLFGVGTPGQIIALNLRGLELVNQTRQDYVHIDPWSWTWWQSALMVWFVAVVFPGVLRIRCGRWLRDSVILSGILAGTLLLGALRDPLALGNTQYNLQLWPLALVVLAHGLGTLLRVEPDGAQVRWPGLLVRVLSPVAVAVVGVRFAVPGLGLKASLVVSSAVLAVVAISGMLARRHGGRARGWEPQAAALIVTSTVFLLTSSQHIPDGVVAQGPSPAYPELPPFAWIDYSNAYGDSLPRALRTATYRAAAQVSDFAYSQCPVDARVAYWPSAPSDGYLAWSVFGPFNSVSTAFPALPATDDELCLVAIGSEDTLDQAEEASGATLVDELVLVPDPAVRPGETVRLYDLSPLDQ